MLFESIGLYSFLHTFIRFYSILSSSCRLHTILFQYNRVRRTTLYSIIFDCAHYTRRLCLDSAALRVSHDRINGMFFRRSMTTLLTPVHEDVICCTARVVLTFNHHRVHGPSSYHLSDGE